MSGCSFFERFPKVFQTHPMLGRVLVVCAVTAVRSNAFLHSWDFYILSVCNTYSTIFLIRMACFLRFVFTTIFAVPEVDGKDCCCCCHCCLHCCYFHVLCLFLIIECHTGQTHWICLRYSMQNTVFNTKLAIFMCVRYM